MSRLPRRDAMVLLAGAVWGSACRISPRREAVLAAVLNDIVIPDLENLGARNRDLAFATQRLVASPSQAELTAARAAWRRAALAWKRASAFRAGPLVESEALLRACYWPTRSAPIRELLTSQRRLGAELLAELGADVKGLYALEFLLFDEAESPLLTPAGERSRELARLYGEELRGFSARALDALHSKRGEFVRGFSARTSASLAQLVGFMTESIENLLTARFRQALWLGSLDRLRACDVEGGRSHSAHELSTALLVATSRLYAGAQGLGQLVRAASPRIHARIESLFASALGLFRALPSIEQAARTRRAELERALAALQALERALKNELPSALGVTLSFAAMDAD